MTPSVLAMSHVLLALLHGRRTLLPVHLPVHGHSLSFVLSPIGHFLTQVAHVQIHAAREGAKGVGAFALPLDAIKDHHGVSRKKRKAREQMTNCGKRNSRHCFRDPKNLKSADRNDLKQMRYLGEIYAMLVRQQQLQTCTCCSGARTVLIWTVNFFLSVSLIPSSILGLSQVMMKPL